MHPSSSYKHTHPSSILKKKKNQQQLQPQLQNIKITFYIFFPQTKIKKKKKTTKLSNRVFYIPFLYERIQIIKEKDFWRCNFRE